MKPRLSALLLAGLASLLILTGCQTKKTTTTTPAPVTGRTLTAMVISDDHVIAPSLHDNGVAFRTTNLQLKCNK